ncbi:chloride channel protein [Extensimonas vulgaris]|uniref:H+/Cl-antiporter ClcA n=1 Tax=Extensimonas vulgaris TaxID=1031594 RepID=A0A369AKQ0_9BURK|nr:chloride channel protein [Extensimonas vulgaris]RCX09741.1 H+/Cl- antiporter ClcA [Extensimonas vulgaris]TWI39371.1 H+/Cl- antiporter ClcA [Extensimonas vulgaris]TXD15619.1 chloride channel protein [Extensimonas vulgaris]
MQQDPLIAKALKSELQDRNLWKTRIVVLVFGAFSGLTVVALTWLGERASNLFEHARAMAFWLPLLWTPAWTALIVWMTRRWAPGAAGSGIPQVMAALHPGVTGTPWKSLYVSFRLSVAKIALTALGLLGGLSQGREGPSVQIGAGIMHSARHWLPPKAAVSPHGLLIAGGAAGIAAAFNTPLGGIMFAIEELSRRPEQRNNGLLMAAIILAGIMGISAYGNATYFGIIRVAAVGWSLWWPAVLVAVVCGLAGGLFSRLLIRSLSERSPDRLTQLRQQYPIRFAAACGLAVAVMGLVSDGAVFGSGYAYNRALLEGGTDTNPLYALLKFLATWLTAWSGAPGGIFAPALSIGGALGHDIALLTGHVDTPTLIALGMAAFLSAVTQAPMTSFIIVMEMVDGHSLVLSLMACSLLASGVSRLISRPLYPGLAELQLRRLPTPVEPTALHGFTQEPNHKGRSS